MNAASPFAQIIIPADLPAHAVDTLTMIDESVTAEAIRYRDTLAAAHKAALAVHGYDDTDPRPYIAGRQAGFEREENGNLAYFLNVYQRLVDQARKRDAAR